jgi:hypothetical protein
MNRVKEGENIWVAPEESPPLSPSEEMGGEQG